MDKTYEPLNHIPVKGYTITISLDPVVFENNVQELIATGLERNEAIRFFLQTPIVVEVFHNNDEGLFMLESEAKWTPLTSVVIADDTLAMEDPTPMQIIDRATSGLEDMASALQMAEEEGDFTRIQMGWLDEAKEKIQEAATELHRFTGPDEQQE